MQQSCINSARIDRAEQNVVGSKSRRKEHDSKQSGDPRELGKVLKEEGTHPHPGAQTRAISQRRQKVVPRRTRRSINTCFVTDYDRDCLSSKLPANATIAEATQRNAEFVPLKVPPPMSAAASSISVNTQTATPVKAPPGTNQQLRPRGKG